MFSKHALYGRHSVLNMFYEYSMENQGELEEFTGFISGEVLGLCQKYNMDYNQCKAWYDGYSLCKWNHSAKTAIKQIKEKKYPKLLKDYTGEMLLIGINYSKRTKKHTCNIEKCLLGQNVSSEIEITLIVLDGKINTVAA